MSGVESVSIYKQLDYHAFLIYMRAAPHPSAQQNWSR